MLYEERSEPSAYADLAEAAKAIFLSTEEVDPSLARAYALRHIVEHCEITPEKNAALLGGEDPFFFNLLLPSLNADRFSRGARSSSEAAKRLLQAKAFKGPCFTGHVTPGVEYVLGQGIAGLQARIEQHLSALRRAQTRNVEKERGYEAMLHGCESVLLYARRLEGNAERLAQLTDDEEWAGELRAAAEVLQRVPQLPAQSFHEALQAFWVVYCVITVEMAGCSVGGGIGLGRLDQSLYPYYTRDLEAGRLTREHALELMEIFLLGFRHCNYYTWHAPYTPGSQASLGGVTPYGADASNELTELIMEASLRLQNPAPYISVRLHRDAPEKYWRSAADFIAGGLGFSVVNDQAIVPALLRHGRSLGDARDYICSCCYEHTIPGREVFHPSCITFNLPIVLELALNGGRSLITGESIGCPGEAGQQVETFDDLLAIFARQLHFICTEMIEWVNDADERHTDQRRYPLMSVFMEDCIARGLDVCSGGSRYNLTGIIVAGLPNTVNSLAAIRHAVFEQRAISMADLCNALKANFEGHDEIRRQLQEAPKWGNGIDAVDGLATEVSEALYSEFHHHRNARDGRFQLALYSFYDNIVFGEAIGASADGRPAGEILTRNLNPAWGTDRIGPTAVLRSVSRIDFTKFPNGTALDLRIDPECVKTEDGREAFAGFLRAFVDLGVMQMQITMVDTETLLDAQDHPERHPDLMVKVAGYTARFVDLAPLEQGEIINRSLHST